MQLINKIPNFNLIKTHKNDKQEIKEA